MKRSSVLLLEALRRSVKPVGLQNRFREMETVSVLASKIHHISVGKKLKQVIIVEESQSIFTKWKLMNVLYYSNARLRENAWRICKYELQHVIYQNGLQLC